MDNYHIIDVHNVVKKLLPVQWNNATVISELQALDIAGVTCVSASNAATASNAVAAASNKVTASNCQDNTPEFKVKQNLKEKYTLLSKQHKSAKNVMAAVFTIFTIICACAIVYQLMNESTMQYRIVSSLTILALNACIIGITFVLVFKDTIEATGTYMKTFSEIYSLNDDNITIDNLKTSAIQNGMLKTMTGGISNIDNAILALRKLLGAPSPRTIEDTDIDDAVNSVIVPRMVAAVGAATGAPPGATATPGAVVSVNITNWMPVDWTSSLSIMEVSPSSSNIHAVFTDKSKTTEAYYYWDKPSKGNWVSTPGVNGVLQYKPGHVVVPSTDPQAVAQDIVNELVSMNILFVMDDKIKKQVHDALKVHHMGGYEAHKSWYTLATLYVSQKLKNQTNENGMIPDMVSVTETLSELNGDEFITTVVWPLIKGSIFVNITHERTILSNEYFYISNEDKYRNLYIVQVFLLVCLILIITALYFAHVVSTCLINSTSIFDNIHQHVVVLVTICLIAIVLHTFAYRSYSNKKFNHNIKKENTGELLKSWLNLREFLIQLCQDAKLSEKQLVVATHYDDISILYGKGDDDTFITRLMTENMSKDRIKTFVRLSYELLNKYDKCHYLTLSNPPPMPIQYIIVYGASMMAVFVTLVQTIAKVDVSTVSSRMQLLNDLKNRVQMGDEDAGEDIIKLLSCRAEDEEGQSPNFNKMIQSIGTILISMCGIVMGVILVKSDKDYWNAINTSFNTMQRCIS
jgi:hypothetical protein